MGQVGLFGKMPSVGDFVSRGFSSKLCEGLDALLQAALVASTADGSDARELMSRARPAMVSIRPGALSATGFTGLWLPSHDRVGRVFPLCIGRETSAEQARGALHWPSHALTVLVGSAVIPALGSGAGPDELLAACPGQEAWDAAAMREVPFSSSGDETVPDLSARVTLFALQGPESDMSTPSRAICSRMPWVAQALGAVLAADGTPDWYFATRNPLSSTPFAAVFDGQWARWEWAETPKPRQDETLPDPLAAATRT